MAKITYDTNVFVDYAPSYFPKGFVMSAVVLQELAAGALDVARLRELETIRKAYEKDGRLLVPNGDDWLQTGKILSNMYRGTAMNNHGRRVKIDKEEQQRILRDVLIARTALKVGAQVVTSNLGDFEKIAAYCAVRVIHASDFFA